MRHPLRFLALAGLLVASAGCGKRFVEPQIGIIQTDTLLPCGAIGYDVQYHFATILNADADPALKAIEEANIGYFFGLEGFIGTASEAVTESLRTLQRETDPTEQLQNGREPWTNSLQITSEAQVIDTLLVYTITLYDYSGGAHGMHSFMAHNYSLRGGYEITLGDLFSPKQQEALTTMIRSKLYQRFNVTDDAGLSEVGFFPEHINTTENFAISPDGITFYYNPYEIACYAVGEVEVAFSKEELTKL